MTMTTATPAPFTFTNRGVARFTDAALDAAIARNGDGTGYHVRILRALRNNTLTAAQRERALRNANTRSNLAAGRMSDHVYAACAEVARVGDGETYPERVVREDHERQQAEAAHRLAVAQFVAVRRP